VSPAPFPEQVGFVFHDVPRGATAVRLAQRAEALGYASLWVAETRLTRDAISLLGALAATTDRIALGTSIVNTWTRGPVLMALTAASLHDLAPGRITLGLGAASDPLIANQGIERRKPLTQMREYVEAVRRLLRLEPVTVDGEVVRVNDVTLDFLRGVARDPVEVPIYIGATGEKMLDLAAEIADGVILNLFLPADYTRAARQRIGGLDAPQLVGVAVSADGDEARAVTRQFVTMYLGGQPHIARELGLDPELVARLTELIGTWPPRPGGLEEAVGLVGSEIVERLAVAGTAAECRDRIGEWVDAGASYPMVVPLTENVEEILEALAPG
jgi:5,10-methylenetetrahydromethanopterin reductase